MATATAVQARVSGVVARVFREQGFCFVQAGERQYFLHQRDFRKGQKAYINEQRMRSKGLSDARLIDPGSQVSFLVEPRTDKRCDRAFDAVLLDKYLTEAAA